MNVIDNISTIIKSERFRRVSKEGSWIIVGQILTVLGSLFGVRVLTEIMSPSVFGELALGMTVATLVVQIITGPLGNGLARFYAPAAEQEDLAGYFKSVRLLVMWSTGFIVVLGLLSVGALALANHGEVIAIVVAALFYSILSGYNSMLNSILNSARQRSIVALHQGVDPWARFFVAVGLLTWFGVTSTIALSGYCIGATIVLLSQFTFFLKTTPRHQGGEGTQGLWQRHILRYSWPFAAWGIFSWAQQVSDRWALEFFATSREVGLFAVLYQLGYVPMSMATGMAVQLLAPIFYQRVGDASDSRRNAAVRSLSWRLTRFALAGTAVAFIVGLSFHAQIFHLLVSRKFDSISYLFPWMIIAGGLFASGQTITLDLQSQMKTPALVKVKIGTAILGIGLNFAGAYLYGVVGIVAAGVLFSLVYFVWVAAISMQLLGATV